MKELKDLKKWKQCNYTSAHYNSLFEMEIMSFFHNTTSLQEMETVIHFCCTIQRPSGIEKGVTMLLSTVTAFKKWKQCSYYAAQNNRPSGNGNSVTILLHNTIACRNQTHCYYPVCQYNSLQELEMELLSLAQYSGLQKWKQCGYYFAQYKFVQEIETVLLFCCTILKSLQTMEKVSLI